MRLLSKIPWWWPWCATPVGFALIILLKTTVSLTFSANVFFWLSSTVIQGFLAALAFAALVGWEQMKGLQNRILEITEKELCDSTRRKLRADALIVRMSELIGRIDDVLSGPQAEPDQTERLKMLMERARSLRKLKRLLMSQAVATVASVMICLIWLPFSELLSGTWLGTVSLSAVSGLGLTCLLLTLCVAYYSVGPGRGKP